MLVALAATVLLANSPQRPPAIQPPSTQAVVAIAQRHLKTSEAKLAFENKRSIQKLRDRLMAAKAKGASDFDQTVNAFVSEITLNLAKMQSPASLLVASCTLALQAPNARTYNLLGSTLHCLEVPREAVTVLGMASQLAPTDDNIALNLAVANLDTKRLPEAKKILDRVVKKNPNLRRAWRSLATYYFLKGDYAAQRDCLLKVADFKGYVRRKIEQKVEEVQVNQPDPADTQAQLEAKLDQLEKIPPMTTADFVEDYDPVFAKQVRDKFLKLMPTERATLPTIPVANTVEHKTFAGLAPIVQGWVEVFGEEYAEYEQSRPEIPEVMSKGTDQEKERAAEAMAKEKIRESMQMAKDNLKFLKGMKLPGASQAQLDKVMKDLEGEAKKTVGPLSNKKGPEPDDVPPGFDFGTPLAKLNYANYVIAKQAYETWFIRFMLMEYKLKEGDILQNYGKKRAEEEKLHQDNSDAHNKAMENQDHVPETCTQCLKENLRHKKKVNEIGEIYFKQWQGLYFPTYAQKMKPKLEAYWRTCMLYIRNMQQKSVMQREYEHVRNTFYTNSMQAGAGMAIGLAFEYVGTTEAEEQALAAAIEASTETFDVDVHPRTLQDFDVPKDDWVKWIGDHLTGEFSIGFPTPPAPAAFVNLTVRMTASSIEIEPYTMGLGAGVKLDWVGNKLETFNSIGPKNKFGISIAGHELFKAETRMDIIRKTATWEFDSGKYKESYTSSSEVKVVMGPVTSGLKYKMDSSLHSSLEAKVTVDAKGAKGQGAKGGFKTVIWD